MEHISTSALLAFLFFLVVCSAFFSGSEIGMMSINRYRLRHLVRQKNRAAMRVQRLLERPDRLLGVILIGNTFANILASAVATIVAVQLFGDIGVAISTIGLTLIILIFAEMAPKTLAAIYPQNVANVTSVLLVVLLYILSPFVWFTSTISNGLLRLLRVNVKHQKSEHLSSDELRTVVHEAGSLIPNEHKEMLVGILDLSQVSIDDIMVPRNEIVGLNLSDSLDEILEDLENSQHTRMPIYEDSIDNVKGMVHLRHVLNYIMEDELTKEALLDLKEDVYFVPEGTALSQQLINFKNAKCRSALVVDEYGDILGLVTMEDILEEVVGEFTTDMAAVGKDVHPQEDGSYLVDGSAMVRELNRTMGWQLPVDGPKTLSGLIIETLEDIPNPGTSIKVAGYPIEVIQVKDNKIKTAQIFLPKNH